MWALNLGAEREGSMVRFLDSAVVGFCVYKSCFCICSKDRALSWIIHCYAYEFMFVLLEKEIYCYVQHEALKWNGRKNNVDIEGSGIRVETGRYNSSPILTLEILKLLTFLLLFKKYLCIHYSPSKQCLCICVMSEECSEKHTVHEVMMNWAEFWSYLL